VILFAALHFVYWFIVRQYIYLTPLFGFFLGWVWDSAIHYYILNFKNKVKLTLREIAGLLLLIGCSFAGISGIILKILGK